MKISKFKPGEIITRIEPGKDGDHSYICERLELVNINTTSIMCRVRGEERKLRIRNYKNGWEYYIPILTSTDPDDYSNRKIEIKKQIDKFRHERKKNGTIFDLYESDYNLTTGKLKNSDKKRRIDKCDELWTKIHILDNVLHGK
jgi:hypothetical protein